MEDLRDHFQVRNFFFAYGLCRVFKFLSQGFHCVLSFLYNCFALQSAFLITHECTLLKPEKNGVKECGEKAVFIQPSLGELGNTQWNIYEIFIQ